jgi:hypothetical protein
MNKRKVLTLAMAAALLAPAGFYASTEYQRQAAATGLGEIDTMATDYLWTPNGVRAVGLGDPDTMATDFLWTPNGIRAIGLGEPDTMATEFLWVAKQVS